MIHHEQHEGIYFPNLLGNNRTSLMDAQFLMNVFQHYPSQLLMSHILTLLSWPWKVHIGDSSHLSEVSSEKIYSRLNQS